MANVGKLNFDIRLGLFAAGYIDSYGFLFFDLNLKPSELAVI